MSISKQEVHGPYCSPDKQFNQFAQLICAKVQLYHNVDSEKNLLEGRGGDSQVCVKPSLVEIGPYVLEKEFEILSIDFASSLLSYPEKSMAFI